MKKLLFTAIAGLSAIPMITLAADAAPAAPVPVYTITTNVGLTSDYYFRGITQTWHKPAIQGGADYVHTNGLYAGIWGSNVSNNQYPGGSALELDYYGGYNGKINDDWGYTVGGHGYYYPGANQNKSVAGNANGVSNAVSQKYDSFEVNVGASWKFISAKYSYFLTDWFGANRTSNPAWYSSSSKGTGYLELNVAYEFVPSWTLNLHAAQTNVKGTLNSTTDTRYKEYLLGVTKAFDGGYSVQLAYLKSTYKNNAIYKPTGSLTSTSDSLADPGEGKFILTVGRSF